MLGLEHDGGPGCIADLDDSGAVDIDDLLIVLGSFDSSGSGDVNNDGIINIDDVLAVTAAWGPCCPG